MPLCNCFRRRSWEKCERGYKGCVYNGGKGSLGAVLLGVFFQELLSLTRSWLNALLYNYKNTNVLILWLEVYYNPYYPGQHLLQLLFLVSTLYFKSCSLVDVVFFPSKFLKIFVLCHWSGFQMRFIVHVLTL